MVTPEKDKKGQPLCYVLIFQEGLESVCFKP